MDEGTPVSSAWRDAWARALLLGLGYFGCAAFAIAFTRFHGGVANLWIASALLVPELATADRPRWWTSLATCSVASLLATTFVGFGPAAAPAFLLANMTEAVIAAGVLRLLGHADDYLETLGGTAALTVASGIVGPALSAFPAAGIALNAGGLSFSGQYLAWLAGHGLGTISFAPFFTLLLNGKILSWCRHTTLRERLEATALFGVLLVVVVGVFAQDQMPLLFVPVLPMVIVAFRLERIGVAISIVLLALVGGGYTAMGHGPINLVQGNLADHARLFQFYLAIITLMMLPVAAELTERRDIFRRLGESEARYKLITESSTDMIITLDTQGVIRYASPSAREVTGYGPAALIGQRPYALPCGPDKATMTLAIERSQAQLSAPTTVEYRARTAEGEVRWYEAHTRATVDANGVPTGWVSAVRDISARKDLELRLAHAATTDPLTGLANRRRFDALLDRKIEDRRGGGSGGCLALFDIDFFKHVNDKHGHAIGDQVLETFAAAVLRTVRVSDVVGRLGGEEFGLLIDGATVEEAAAICERVRRAVAGDTTFAPSGVGVSVTVSAGLVEIRPGMTRREVMRAADTALYRAKADGRDRLALAA